MTKNTGFVSKMPAHFSDNVVIGERGPRARYRDVELKTPWGLVNQRIREDNIRDKSGNKLFEGDSL